MATLSTHIKPWKKNRERREKEEEAKAILDNPHGVYIL